VKKRILKNIPKKWHLPKGDLPKKSLFGSQCPWTTVVGIKDLDLDLDLSVFENAEMRPKLLQTYVNPG
jgi:hypothetical protein